MAGSAASPLLPTPGRGRRGCRWLCCQNKLMFVSAVLWLGLAVFALWAGEVLFGLFGLLSFPSLPPSNITDLSAPFDRQLAVHLAQSAAVACCPASAVQQWTCGSCPSQTGVHNVTVIASNYSGGLQAVVALDRGAGTAAVSAAVTVAFRGTFEPKNWDIDFDVKQAPAAPYLNPANDSRPAPWMVHDGFQKAYTVLRGDVRRAVAGLCHLRLPVNITGHSLGGSLATLAALDLATNPVCGRPSASASTLATYGMPRTGNPAFVAGFEAAMRAANRTVWRVTHSGDVVPTSIPRSLVVDGVTYRYRHTSREVWFSEDSKDHSVCDGSGEDPSCSANVPSLAHALLDHQVYMGVAFTNPCGGNAEAPLAKAVLMAAGGFSLAMMVAFILRVRRCRRLQREQGDGRNGAWSLNNNDYLA